MRAVGGVASAADELFIGALISRRKVTVVLGYLRGAIDGAQTLSEERTFDVRPSPAAVAAAGPSSVAGVSLASLVSAFPALDPTILALMGQNLGPLGSGAAAGGRPLPPLNHAMASAREHSTSASQSHHGSQVTSPTNASGSSGGGLHHDPAIMGYARQAPSSAPPTTSHQQQPAESRFFGNFDRADSVAPGFGAPRYSSLSQQHSSMQAPHSRGGLPSSQHDVRYAPNAPSNNGNGGVTEDWEAHLDDESLPVPSRDAPTTTSRLPLWERFAHHQLASHSHQDARLGGHLDEREKNTPPPPAHHTVLHARGPHTSQQDVRGSAPPMSRAPDASRLWGQGGGAPSWQHELSGPVGVGALNSSSHGGSIHSAAPTSRYGFAVEQDEPSHQPQYASSQFQHHPYSSQPPQPQPPQPQPQWKSHAGGPPGLGGLAHHGSASNWSTQPSSHAQELSDQDAFALIAQRRERERHEQREREAQQHMHQQWGQPPPSHHDEYGTPSAFGHPSQSAGEYGAQQQQQPRARPPLSMQSYMQHRQ